LHASVTPESGERRIDARASMTGMEVSLCNEVLRDFSFERQCEFASGLGYDGLEIAPFTLSENPHELSSVRRAEVRRIAERAGLRITSLHWLLLTPLGLSITSADPEVRQRTVNVLKGLAALCSDLGGSVLVHGSPKQRLIPAGEERGNVERRAEECFAEVALEAQALGIRYCIEPLAPAETNYINSLEQAEALVTRVGNPAFRTMIDTKAAAAESLPVHELCEKWIPTGLIGHIHLNDRNLRAPGQGADRFLPTLAVLRRLGYQGVVAVEPFDYFPDGPTAAARAIGYIRGIGEGLDAMTSTKGETR